ncbi:hypothetical protein AK812_SmicGene40940 [Symbiodinium microadriaticum]|uniref:Uncharacterized protein n=1 Tax=Symbiodinium microadriaticum TaxID=2951 RepID=A0A1Q9C7C5_SYMMI|nr:hypothetical protein AK812_SmicGene40940 [Symbiodinium microadriaticum]
MAVPSASLLRVSEGPRLVKPYPELMRWVFIISWMGHPAIMTVPFMAPEMIHGPSHYHPMAMIVDPAVVMPKLKEKQEKKSKKGHREERDREREKQKRKAEKTADASTKRHEQEKRQQPKEKVAKHKEKHMGEEKAGSEIETVAARKERKVDDEDL